MTTAEYCGTTAPASVMRSRPAQLPVRPRAQSFTIDGDDALERHLAGTCDRVLSGVRGLIPPRKLEALFLGGGYGRGEGGVLRHPAGDHPYNDLEFYVAIRGNRHVNEFRYRRRLEALSGILTHLAGVEVEIKITSLAELAAQPVSMFSHDLVAGHRLLWGGPSAQRLTGCAHHRSAEDIPPLEATRLLMNRCSGLLLARVQLAREPFTSAAEDFVRRNIAKAQLACGDAILAAGGLYRWSCRERHRALQDLARLVPSPWHDTLLRHHAAGVEFKLHPESGGVPRAALRASHAEVTALARQCWLGLESRRLRRSFPSARAYAADPIDKCPGTFPLRNFLLNLRIGGFPPQAQPSPWRHPRQRVFHALALLLWEPAALTDPLLQSRLRTELPTHATTADEWVESYKSLWSQVR